MNKDVIINWIYRRLEEWSSSQPDKIVFTEIFIDNSRREISYIQFKSAVDRYSSYLESKGVGYDTRCMLMFSEVIEFIIAFYACSRLGAIAIPLISPENDKDISFWNKVIEDSDCGYIFTDKGSEDRLRKMFPRMIVISRNENYTEVNAVEKANELLFLQYTSGSTGSPKGVMISHDSMKANIDAFCPKYRYCRDSVIVSWLPYYHDLGLIQMLIANVYCGSMAIVMMPSVFISDPIKWLETISEFHATATCAPNFAFDLTAKALESYTGDLDLSSLEAMSSGGESINMNSMIRFCRSAGKHGFSDASLLFGYGQAEATLVVSVCGCGEKNRWVKVEREKFQNGKLEILEKGVFKGNDELYPTDDDSAIYLLGNGTVVRDHEITIREPGGENCLQEYTMGEICFSGDSLAMGYYRNEEKTAEIFKTESTGKKFLRTGDMGFLDEYGVLYITGRIKDLIIINGENFYPQDIEVMVSALGEYFTNSGAIAFSYQDGNAENLAIVQEICSDCIVQDFHFNELLCHIRSEVFKVFGIAPRIVAFVPENTLPRTASGKLKRSALRDSYMKNGLRGIGQLIAYTESSTADVVGSEAIAEVKSAISRMMLIPVDRIDDCAVFEQLGISSVIALKLCIELKRKYPGLKMSDIFRCNTAEKLASYLDTLEKVQYGVENVPAEEKTLPEVFPMSSIQETYHIGANPELAWGAVDCYYACEFETESLNIDRFRQALEILMVHQPMLRCVKTEDGRQRICDTLAVPLIVYEKVSLENEYSHILKIRSELKERIFAVGEPMFDVRVAEINDGSYRIFLGISLFICDAYSILIFLEELKTIYSGKTLAPLSSDYRHYIEREQALEGTEKYHRDKEYWLSRIDTLPGIPKLPMNIIREGSARGRFGRVVDFIQPDIWQNFMEQAKKHNVTPSMVLLGIYIEVLKEYGAGTSFGVMTTVMDREVTEERVIGEYTRLALLTANKREGTFFERVLKLQKQVQEDLSHLLYTPMELVKEMRGRGKDAFYPVVFTSVLDNDHSGSMDRPRWSFSQTPQVFLDFQAISCGGGVSLSFDAIEDLFYENTLSDMFESLMLLVKAAAQEADFYEKEQFDVRTMKQKMIQKKINQTSKKWNRNMSLIAFMENWQTYADKTAVVYEKESYTYRQLVSRGIGYCNMLRRQAGWKKGERVLIKLPKSFEQIAAIVGVLLAEGCYVPVLKDLGQTRIHSIMERSQCRFVIDAPLTETEPNDTSYTLSEKIESEIAYIIFTSGSTGEPKGVPITHNQAMNTIYAVNRKFCIGSEDTFIAVSSVSFDLSVFDIFGCFNVFGTLIVPSEDERIDPEKLYTLIHENHVTVYNSVPAIMEMLTEAMGNRSESSLEKILLSGDWIPLSLPSKIAKAFPNAKIYSLGGATEASIWSIYYPITKVQDNWSSIPYGYPLDNQKFFILDKYLKPVPIGVKGRLFIAGVGIANGYFNDVERSNQSFIALQNGTRVYDTGDYGRYMEDGCIEFLGRQDDQVKINGYRVELGEIEKAFASIGVTNRVTVISVGDKMGDKHLVAFIENESELDTYSLKKSLEEFLPSYCVPQSIIAVYPLPFTENGKSDKKKLESIYKSRVAVKQAEKFTENMSGSRVIAIAAEVFNYPDISIDTPLYDIGIASIDIIRFANRLDLEFGSRPTIQQLMNYRTLRELLLFYADTVTEDRTSEYSAGNVLLEYIKGLEVITDQSERQRFAKQDIAYRYDLSTNRSIPIEESNLDGILLGLYEKTGRDRKLFSYPSVEGVYSVQLYVAIPGKGVFYADTRKRRLVLTAEDITEERITFYTVAAMDAAYPIYGQDTLKNVFVESGTMLGRVELPEGMELKITICENDDTLRKRLLLGRRHMLLNMVQFVPETVNLECADAESIVKKFAENGVQLFTDDEKLRFRAREGTMTEDMRAKLRADKEDILYYLQHQYDSLPDRYRPFGLTPIQQAYLVGRKPGYEIGGVNAHYYIEFETDRLDIGRFEDALNKLIRIHDMLKTVVYEDGTQRVLENIPRYAIEVHENADILEQIALRSSMRQKKYTLGTWPLFTIAISRTSEEKDTVHFSLDCILMDAFSTQKTIYDLFRIYYKESVAEPTFTFREYLQRESEYVEKSGIKEKSEKFWNERLNCIPPAPAIPYEKDLTSIQDPVFEREKYIFTEEETSVFSKKVKKYHFTENAVSTYCFMDALSEICGQEKLTLNLTMYNRYPLNKETDSILGDFTNTSLLPYEKKDSVLESIRAVGEGMMQSVEYNGCVGIDLVKRLKEQGGSRVIPVVMTSMLHDSQLTGFREIYSISCTPQVVLDGQAYYRNKNMILGFDYVPEAFNGEWINRFFELYIRKVKELISSEDWTTL